MESFKRKQRLWLSITLVFTFAVSIAAQSTPDEPETPSTTGAITGQVVTETGQALAGAMVFVRSYGGARQGRSSLTDAEGNFKVVGLDPLTYVVSVSYPAYIQAPRDLDSSQPFYYRIGDRVRLQLIKGGVITGTVTSADGEPVVGVSVQASMIRDGNGQAPRYGSPLRERTTDDRGIYRLYGLPAGTYAVSAGGGRGFSAFNPNPYETDVATYSPSSPRDTAMEVNVNAGEETANIDIRYRGEPGHIISGKAIDPTPAASPSAFTITLSTISNGASEMSQSTYQPPGSRGFSLPGIADGDYDLVAQSYFPSGEWMLAEPLRVRVRGADITGIELTVKPLGSVSGRVALEESKLPECKGKRRPVLGEILIGPWHNEKIVVKDQPQFPWSLGAPTMPDSQGDFTLRNLAPGQYQFRPRSFAKYWYLKSISARPSLPLTVKAAQATRAIDAARNWTMVKRGERVSGLIITFAEGAASLKGQIKLAQGQKLPPKSFIYLVPAEGDKAEDVLRFFASLVATDGSFAVNNLPPGRYLALAKAAVENESNVLSKLRLPDETEARAKLRREATLTKTETELKPCQNVTDFQLALDALQAASKGSEVKP